MATASDWLDKKFLDYIKWLGSLATLALGGTAIGLADKVAGPTRYVFAAMLLLFVLAVLVVSRMWSTIINLDDESGDGRLADLTSIKSHFKWLLRLLSGGFVLFVCTILLIVFFPGL